MKKICWQQGILDLLDKSILWKTLLIFRDFVAFSGVRQKIDIDYKNKLNGIKKKKWKKRNKAYQSESSHKEAIENDRLLQTIMVKKRTVVTWLNLAFITCIIVAKLINSIFFRFFKKAKNQLRTRIDTSTNRIG